MKIAVIQHQPRWLPLCIAVRFVARMEYRSSVISWGEVKLVVVVARLYDRSSEVDWEMVFRRFWLDVVRDVLVALESRF